MPLRLDSVGGFTPSCLCNLVYFFPVAVLSCHRLIWSIPRHLADPRSSTYYQNGPDTIGQRPSPGKRSALREAPLFVVLVWWGNRNLGLTTWVCLSPLCMREVSAAKYYERALDKSRRISYLYYMNDFCEFHTWNLHSSIIVFHPIFKTTALHGYFFIWNYLFYYHAKQFIHLCPCVIICWFFPPDIDDNITGTI